MSALRQVLGGLLAVALVGATVAASTLLAYGWQAAAPSAQSSPTAAQTEPPATAIPMDTATRPAPTATATLPPPTATVLPSATATRPPSATPTSAPPTLTATAPPAPTAAPTLAPPSPAPTTCVVAPPAGWEVYTIQRGDTLFNLGLRFGVGQAALQRVNCIANPSGIQAGQRIFVPRLATQPPPATSTPAVSPTVPADIPTITSIPIPTATPDCAPPEFYDPLLGRCRLPDS